MHFTQKIVGEPRFVLLQNCLHIIKRSLMKVGKSATRICFTENLSFKSSATLVNSQLVCLQPVGILNPIMFNLYVDLIIYSMALKSPHGELSLEVVFCFVFVLCEEVLAPPQHYKIFRWRQPLIDFQ